MRWQGRLEASVSPNCHLMMALCSLRKNKQPLKQKKNQSCCDDGS